MRFPRIYLENVKATSTIKRSKSQPVSMHVIYIDLYTILLITN